VWAATKICPPTANNGCPVTANVATHRDNQGIIDIARTATRRHIGDAIARVIEYAVWVVG
jgi:hypothetical protein